MEYKINSKLLPQKIYKSQINVSQEKVPAKNFIFIRINIPKIEGHNFELLGVVFKRTSTATVALSSPIVINNDYRTRIENINDTTIDIDGTLICYWLEE